MAMKESYCEAPDSFIGTDLVNTSREVIFTCIEPEDREKDFIIYCVNPNPDSWELIEGALRASHMEKGYVRIKTPTGKPKGAALYRSIPGMPLNPVGNWKRGLLDIGIDIPLYHVAEVRKAFVRGS